MHLAAVALCCVDTIVPTISTGMQDYSLKDLAPKRPQPIIAGVSSSTLVGLKAQVQRCVAVEICPQQQLGDVTS